MKFCLLINSVNSISCSVKAMKGDNLVNNLLSCSGDHSMLPSVKEGDRLLVHMLKRVIMKKDFVKHILTISP